MSVKSEHKQPTQSKTTGENLLGCSENMGGIHTYGIDGTVVTSHLSNWHKSIHVPEFQDATSAAAEQNRVAWHQAQGTDPVLVCVWDLLGENRESRTEEEGLYKTRGHTKTAYRTFSGETQSLQKFSVI